MAARGSGNQSARRGARTGQGATARREGLAPFPSLAPYVPGIDSLEEICGSLGTFRARLRIAHVDERDTVLAVFQQLDARYVIGPSALSGRTGRKRPSPWTGAKSALRSPAPV